MGRQIWASVACSAQGNPAQKLSGLSVVLWWFMSHWCCRAQMLVGVLLPFRGSFGCALCAFSPAGFLPSVHRELHFTQFSYGFFEGSHRP